MDEKELNQLLIENRKMRQALEYIEEWHLPMVTYRGVSCTYESAYGSNGAREAMRKVAREAL